MPSIGEIILVQAPMVGYRKYHLCLGPNEAGVFLFLYLNSENGFDGDAGFDCSRIPSLPPSKTGQSVVSFSMMPRFTQAQLDLYGMKPCGFIPKDVAEELVKHCSGVKTLSRPEKNFAMDALSAIIQ